MISEVDYYSRPEVSNSTLTALKKMLEPSWFIDLYDIFRFGTLVDVMITEPHKLDYFKKRIGEYSYNQGELDQAQRMKDVFFKDPLCADLHKNSVGQKIFIHPSLEIQHDGYRFTLPARCKYDLFVDDYDMQADIKTTSCTSLAQFRKSIDHFDYDRQGSWYLDLPKRNNFVFIGISKEKTPQIFIVTMKRGDDLYKSGKEKYQQLAFKHWALF